MSKLRISRRAWIDMLDVKAHTAECFGPLKLAEYEDLIAEAFEAIAADPTQGKPRSAARPGILAYHIAQPGRRARHMLLYRLDTDGTVEVVRFLHDAMDFERHLPDDDSDA